ncbi:MAG: YggS family pyridoxal phosphate-dependent enzyme [Clostridia bacterium]|nr:YggS family pyridoxal phosphate-dependent enzyme [Clostridia bacterium]
MDNAGTLKDNVMRLRDEVANACAAVGRSADDVRIVAATKCVPQSVAERLPALGIDTAGENRVQEFLQKYRVDSPLRWHIIGALQTNKVKYVVGKAEMIQSVDRLSLLQEIDKLSARQATVTDILVEVNIGREENKSGVLPEAVDELTAAASEMRHVRLRGLMSVPPVQAPVKLYEQMRELFVRLRQRQSAVDTLSVGMSNDYITAVRCGATMIRPGRALFGARDRYEKR